MDSDIFREWACSLSGCDGGSEDAEFWLSGIEWGHPKRKDGSYYIDELPRQIKEGRYQHVTGSYDWASTLRTPYGKNVAKLYAAYTGHAVEEYATLAETYTGKELFKLNLYPIAFHSTNPSLWKKNGLEKLTGMDEKQVFQTWCFLNRFPVFSKLVMRKKPKLVVGTGLSYLRDFFVCYGGSGASADRIRMGEIKPASAKNRGIRRYYWVRVSDETTLFVIPFFSGSNGLNSNYLIQKMGEKIRELCT